MSDPGAEAPGVASAPARPAEGARIGVYELKERLGEGASGVVHRAVADGQEVALKVIRAELAADEQYRRRLAHEVRAAREIRHRHVVPVVDAGEADGVLYIAFAYVPGSETLARRLEGGPQFSATEVVRLGLQIASAVDAMHAAGLVHRDIKPSNIILTGEQALLTDFGLAKGAAYTALTRPGRILGSVDYLAPELIHGAPATAASDLYAFGCTLYECTTGRPPFAGRGVIATGVAQLEEPPPDPSVVRPDLPAAFSFALVQALAKEPERRPPTALAYAHLLQVALPVAADG